MSEPLPETTQPRETAPADPTATEGSSRRGILPDPRRKSVLLATVLSAMPGLGQVYVGYVQRGFVHILVVGTLVATLTDGDLGPVTTLLSLFLAFFWLYNVIDAGRRAALVNFALAGGTDMELPDELEGPSLRGSLAGGVALMAVGLALLGNTAFGMSLAWVEQWWPAIFVIFGAYLAWKARQAEADRGRGDAWADESLED